VTYPSLSGWSAARRRALPAWWAGRDNAALPEPASNYENGLKTRRIAVVRYTPCLAVLKERMTLAYQTIYNFISTYVIGETMMIMGTCPYADIALAFCFRQLARQAGLCQSDDVLGGQNIYSDSIHD